MASQTALTPWASLSGSPLPPMCMKVDFRFVKEKMIVNGGHFQTIRQGSVQGRVYFVLKHNCIAHQHGTIIGFLERGPRS